MCRGHLGPCSFNLNDLGKDCLVTLHINFQAFEPSCSEKEDFLNIFYVFLCFNLGPLAGRYKKVKIQLRMINIININHTQL